MPTVLVTYLATLQFYVPGDASTDRLGLPAALLLTLLAITFLVTDDFPRSAHLTTIGKFNIGNLVWMTLSMIESSFVLYMSDSTNKLRIPVLKTLLELQVEEQRGVRSGVGKLYVNKLFTEGVMAIYIVYCKKIVPVDPTVTMGELGLVLDMFVRVVYPVSCE